MLQYSYDIKINSGAGLLNLPTFAEACPYVNEMLITSKQYENLVDCEKDMNSVLAVLNAAERLHKNKPRVILVKINPLHSQEPAIYDPKEQWDDFTVMKCFIADAERLKKSELQYEVFSQIKTFNYASIDTYQ
jgi:hypothetical protein